MSFIKKAYAFFLNLLTLIFSIDFAKQVDTYLRFTRKLNLKNPQTLADKVTYLFLHKRTPLMSACTDKLAVREYITQKRLSNILIPTVGGPWNKVEEIDFNKLPNKFILKATHGCKMNYIVKDKSKLDIVNCKKTLQSWLNITYGTYSVEPHYKTIPHRIYAEDLLEINTEIIDYKIHCLNGVPQFILVVSDRDTSKRRMSVKLDLFDTQWNSLNKYLQISGLEVPNLGKTKCPSQLDKMLDIAKQLSTDFSFVRVDLYEIEGKIYFGELTFSPAVGIFSYFTDEFIINMGARLKI